MLFRSFYGDPKAAVEACVTMLDRCEPDAERHGLYSRLFAIYKEAQSALAPLNHRLHAIVQPPA